MHKTTIKRIAATTLAVALVFSGTILPVGEENEAVAAAKKVSLKKSSFSLKITQNKKKVTYGTAQIKVKKSKGVKVKKVTYKSEDKKIAKVSSKGKITAKKAGGTKVKVTVKYKYGKKTKKQSFKCKVKVANKYKNVFMDIRVLHTAFSTYVGGAEGISPRFLVREDKIGDFYAWDCMKLTAKDPSIISIGECGLIKGKKPGTTTVTVKTTDGTNLSATVKVKVYETRRQIPAEEDLYFSQYDSLLDFVEAGWSEEEKQRFIDEDGNIHWDFFAAASMDRKMNIDKLREKLKNAQKKQEKTAEDALASVISTTEELKSGKGQDKYLQIIRNKITDRIFKTKSIAELKKLTTEYMDKGLNPFIFTCDFLENDIGLEEYEAILLGEKELPKEEIEIRSEFYESASWKDSYASGYLKMGKKEEMVNYIKTMLGLVGVTDQNIIDQTVSLVEEFNSEWKKDQNIEGYDASELDSMFPNMNLRQMFTDSNYLTGKDDEIIYLEGVSAMKLLDQKMSKEENLTVLQGYMALIVAEGIIDYSREGYGAMLRAALADKNYDYSPDEWEELIDDWYTLLLDGAIDRIPWDLDRVYTKTFYKPSYKKQFERMTERYIASYEKKISECWMDTSTKQNFLKKLKTMKFNNLWASDEEYKERVIQVDLGTAAEGTNFAENLIKIKKYTADRSRSVVGSTGDKDSFMFPVENMDSTNYPWSNNAFYSVFTNTCYFCHTNMAPIFLDNPTGSAETDQKNIAYMATTIGHEMGHAFDKYRSIINSDGNLEVQWTENDGNIYNSKVKKIEALYDTYFLCQNREYNSAVYQDGENTITEAMADLGGTEVALDVLKESYPDASDEVIRQFFKYTAEQWVDTTTVDIPDSNISYYMEDVHPQTRARTNGVASLMEEFYRVFDISEDNAMYVAPEDRVELWSKE